MSNCKNCNQVLTGNYCSNCGQPTQTKRIDGHYIVHEIEHVLHFEKGILYTVKELLIRPGQNVREFISENRVKLVKPIIFIIVTSLIYTFSNHFFHIEDGYINFSGAKDSAITKVFNWIQEHYGYANIIIGMFIAFWLSILFRKYAYNFFEILILLCFVLGIEMLILSVFAIFTGLTNLNLMKGSGIIAVIYGTWAIGQFFDKKKKINYVKALISYLLGMVTFSISALLLGLLADVLIKH